MPAPVAVGSAGAPDLAWVGLAVYSPTAGPGYPRENNQRLIVSLVHAANRRIVITMPYLIPDEAQIGRAHV